MPPLPVPLLFVSAFAAPVSVADDAGAAVLPAELTVLLFPPNMFLRLSLTMSVTVLAAPHIDPGLLPAPVVPPPPPPPVPFPVPVFFPLVFSPLFLLVLFKKPAIPFTS